MKNHVKILIAVIVAVALLAGCGLWAYFEQTVALADILPQEWWDVGLVAVVYEDGQTQNKAYAEEKTVSGEIMKALRGAQVERARSYDDVRADFFWIVVWTGDGHDMWNLCLTHEGLLRVTGPDSRNYYFENCQGLYRQIQTIAEDLPLAE